MSNVAFRLSTGDHQNRLKLSDPPKPPQTLTEKYRPRDLASVVGQGEVIFRIESFLEAPYSSAWFFDGSTGIGKTTVALAIAAELGAVEFGGLEEIKSGMQDAEAVERVLHNLRYTPMLGSGWKVVVVDEADYMSHKASQLWLSALEPLPDKSVVIFTTNKPSKFDDRFLNRCERLTFSSASDEHRGDAQELVNRVWTAETGSLHGAPNAQWLNGVVDDNGAISYRRVIRALEPLLAARGEAVRASRANAANIEELADKMVAIFTPPSTATRQPDASSVTVEAVISSAPLHPSTSAKPRKAMDMSPDAIAKRKAAAQKGLETWRRNQEALKRAAGHFSAASATG